MFLDKIEKRMTYKELDSYTWNSLNTLSVTNEDLLKEETYMRCISYIANKMSSIPIKIMKTTPKGNIEFTQHKLYNILKNKPNQYQNSVDLIKALYTLATHEGIAGLYINRADNTLHLCKINRFLLDDAMLFDENSVNLMADITINGFNRIAYEKDVIIIRNGITYDGLQVHAIKDYLKDDIRNIKTGSNFLEKLFANGNMNNKIAISTVSDIKDTKELKKLQDKFNSLYSANGNIFTLPAGFTLQNLSNSLSDSQFNELRKLSKTSIANSLGLSPSMVGLTDNAPTEEENIRFLTDTILPLVRAFEVEANNKLLSELDKNTFIKLDVNVLLRVSPKVQQEIICEYTKNGIYSLELARSILGVTNDLKNETVIIPSGYVTLKDLINNNATWQNEKGGE